MTIDRGPTAQRPDAATGGPSERDIAWEAPGPGSWRFDATHCTRPIGRFTEAVLVEPYAEGFRRGMRLIGSPLDTMELATVNGWSFARAKPLGEPDGPSGDSPPKLVMAALFRLDPELRRRHRTAKQVFTERRWLPIVESWEGDVKPRFRARLDELATIEPSTLDDDGLARHVEQLALVAVDATINHFSNAPVVALVIGDLLNLATDHGLTGLEALSTTMGYATPVTEATERADRVVAALRASGGLAAIEGPPETLFTRIAEVGPSVRVELDQYLDTVGVHLAGGESVADPTVAECPDVVQSLLRRRAEIDVDGHDPRAAADVAAQQMAARLPASLRSRWLQAVTDARLVAPLRDDDVQPLIEALGRSRLALLEVGRRLVARGIADRPDDAVELRPEEVAGALAGTGITARELRSTVELRCRQASLSPPPVLGPPSGPPPIDRFPAAVARVLTAVGAFVSRFAADGDGPTADGCGHGASPGRVTAPARVVRTLDQLDRMEPGDVLVARATSPTFNTVLAIAGAVVTETGGSICHAAVMARELGIPAVVGFPGALSIPDGAQVSVDGDRGTVEVVGRDVRRPPEASPDLGADDNAYP